MGSVYLISVVSFVSNEHKHLKGLQKGFYNLLYGSSYLSMETIMHKEVGIFITQVEFWKTPVERRGPTIKAGCNNTVQISNRNAVGIRFPIGLKINSGFTSNSNSRNYVDENPGSTIALSIFTPSLNC